MRELSIVQIGDIHFPDHKHERDQDAKDTAFPEPLRMRMTTQRLSTAITKAAKARDHLDAAVMICGDITTQGDKSGYQAGVELLADVLQLKARPEDEWHVALGNHDIDRDAAAPDLSGDAQYAFARDAWKPYEVLAIDAPRITTHTRGPTSLRLVTLNSCIGSGARRTMPEPMQKLLQEQTEKALKTATARNKAASAVRTALVDVYENLDTPGFEDTHIKQVVEDVETLSHTAVPVVLAHHNLLPQATPRFAAYTELVNGGAVRTQLASCDRPVVYLHGHIHEEAVEVVDRHLEGAGTLVIISAPLLVEGFNVVTVQFSNLNRLLGLVVTRYSWRNGGSVLPDADSVRVPLLDSRVPANRLHMVLQQVMRANPISRFSDVVDNVSSLEPGCTRDEVQDAVLEAEWAGMISISDRREANPSLWTIHLCL